MNLKDLKLCIAKDLELQLIPSTIILDKLRVVNEDSRKASAYVDSTHVPFYYYLGKYIEPKNLIEIGVNLGFFSCAFFKSCKTVENYLAYQENIAEYFSKRLVEKNIKDNFKNNFDFYYGIVTDQEFLNKVNSIKWDLAFINEEKYYDKYFVVMDTVWENLSDGGMLVMENIITHSAAKDAFNNFCKVKNRESVIFNTRYGTGIVIK
jgi:predicted O-methyltransferase YrrM